MRLETATHRRGQAIVLVALMATLLFGVAAVAMDLSLAMVDRRQLQASADAAALAGAISYRTSPNAAHWVTMQYLQQPLGFTLPLGSCTGSAACPAGTYATGAYTITIADAANNQMDLTLQHTEPTLFAGVIGLGNVKTGSSVRAMAPGPTIIPSTYVAVATTGSLDVTGGGATNRVFGNSVWAKTDFGDNNGGIHTTVDTYVTDLGGTQCPGNLPVHVDHAAATNALAFAWAPTSGPENFNVAGPPLPYDNAGPTPAAGAPTFTTVGFPASAQDGSGNWKPGIYNGVYPSAPGKLNPGVYKLVNNTGAMSFGALTQVTYTAPGTEDAAGAAVITLDSSDTGAIDISSVVLNGIDDLHPQSYVGPRDPQGTHNFVFWSPSGASGYTGTIDMGPGVNANLSGIFYLPNFTITGHGNPTEHFTGMVTVSSWTISGGGDATQIMRWVCGLGAVLNNAAIQGGLNR